jgi:hypothetical protein
MCITFISYGLLKNESLKMCQNGHMRQKGTSEQLAEQRALGLSLLAQRETPKEVAEILGVTRRSVNRWDYGVFTLESK